MMPVIPLSCRRIVADGRHNAFASFERWRGSYWLAFRTATGHVSRDGDIVLRRSTDTHEWDESIRLDVAADDRDPQLLPFAGRLFLYTNGLTDGAFRIHVSCTDDGEVWSQPRPAYEDGFILWKPVAHDGRFYAGAHRPGTDAQRESHLVTSTDGLHWEKVSTIRSGQGESETTLLFGPDGQLTAFLRSQQTVGGSILESAPPYVDWSERPAGVHLSGHAVHRFDGVTYLIGRLLRYQEPVHPTARRADVLGKQLDQATIAYTYEGDRLHPYCLLSPLDGNHDSSYAAAVQDGDDMLIVHHRAAHEFAGDYEARDAADILLSRVPLRQPRQAGETK